MDLVQLNRAQPIWLCRTFLLAAATWLVITPLTAAGVEPLSSLEEVAKAADAIEIEFHSREEYEAAGAELRRLIAQLDSTAEQASDAQLDTKLDRRLLRSRLEIRRFEIEDVALWRQVPVRYLALSSTDSLLLRPCAAGSEAVGRAIEELERLPTVLKNARANLERPARTWTENAIYTARYAELLLGEELAAGCIETANRGELLAAAEPALAAVRSYAEWMDTDLLPRSTRSPAWKPEEVEHYHVVQEWLDDTSLDDFERIAEVEEAETERQMRELAKRIHPSGELDAVWEVMKDETPPWSEVEAMAERYVRMTADWLSDGGAHLLSIPDGFDYGTVVSTPMARRILSFGGASYGPTIAGRISGYYVLTPLEPWLSDEERASRLRSYNPYWTHVISYHEWVGHNVQRAWAEKGRAIHSPNPTRSSYRSAYLSQAWSFYLEKLFEDEGYYEVLPHAEALKTRMARLQMRMWRIQRILTKVGMAKGTMTFDQAVTAYVEKIGMEPTNAFIEVQRDCQSPSSPGREIIGERLILDLWQEYQKRMGEHARVRDFHEALLSYGELPLPAIRQLMFRTR